VSARIGPKIRRARASDKNTVLEFCRFTWQEYGDYIDKVWDDWLEDKKGFFAVACLRGRPIATAKLTVLSPGQIWFEGLRVDPRRRGIGMSRVLTRFLLRKARRLGAETVRFATGEYNRPSKHVGRDLGFRLIRHYSILWAPSDGRFQSVFAPLSDPVRAVATLHRAGNASAPEQTAPASRGRHDWLPRTGASSDRTRGVRKRDMIHDATEKLACLVNSSPFGRAMKGLASSGWTFFQVDADLLAQHFESRGLFLATSRAGNVPGSSESTPLGIIVASRNRKAQRLDVKLFADVTEDSLGPMLLGTKKLAYELKLPRVRLVLPKVERLLLQAKEAGFREEDPGFYHAVMEKRIRGGPKGRRSVSGQRNNVRGHNSFDAEFDADFDNHDSG